MTYRSGLLILTLSISLSSFNGLMVRLAEDPDPWAAVMGRYMAQAVGMTIAMVLMSRRGVAGRFLAMGWQGFAASVCYGLGSVGFIVALALTTVAETMFVLSAMPVVTAIAARLVLGEQVRPTAWIAMAGSAAGIVVMFSDGAVAGNLMGLFAAICCVLTMAAYGVGLRWGRSLDMMPTAAVGGLVAGLIALAVAPGAPAAMPLHDMLLFAFWGGILATVFSVLFILGSKVVPGGEMMLFVFIEAVLSPFWVWLFVGEVPARSTFWGGAIVLGSVAIFAFSGFRRPQPVVPEPPS